VSGSWERRDPGYLVLRRAVRVTLVACIGFDVCRYVLHNAALAPYALFGAVALGALAQIPGGPAQRARTLVAVLPVAWVLVALGTLLSVNTAAAVAGMFVLGFAVSFVGVGGPRLVGLATGLQLLYILPCFPPFDPGALPERLAGVTLAVLLLAAAELVVWPEPQPEPYTARLGRAVAALAGCLDAVADCWTRHPDRVALASLLPGAAEAGEALRPSAVPPGERPASAGRRDRALSLAAGTTRLLLGRTIGLAAVDRHDVPELPAAAALLHQAASCAAAAAEWLAGTTPELPDTDRVEAAVATFRAARLTTPVEGEAPERLRLGSLALALGEWTVALVASVRVVAGAPVRPGIRSSPLWFADLSARELWWHRLRENLTPRSVAFQGALRLAAALAVARLLAGVLDLSHGFWVLLTILTVLRASAAETRAVLRPALVGTTIGALVAALLLVVGIPTTVYAIVLPLVMIVGFAAGPLLGPGWAQALFTLVITVVFAQVAPVDWQLAEARLIDVAAGAAVGVIIGLLAWPRGGSGELHRAAGTFLADAATVVRETVGVLAFATPPGDALPRAWTTGRLAEASYALYQTERHGASRLDWQATLLAGHHAVRGAEALRRHCPDGRRLPGADALGESASDVVQRFDRLSDGLLRGDPAAALRPIRPVEPAAPPDGDAAELYLISDLAVWLDGLRDDLSRAAADAGRGADVRATIARLADGATG
jgi:Fusaric acid resistance protein-like